ncbi:putative transporter SEO1 [Wickerhamomyces ciferrii]|uniref:Transporter SEO1 n=1 Tax=Wickerhamomyces ciferrii (strain ATCC 14091 / BCRC 22168 / CBS 111 / JCM 3599 / NBRC 0793 / NRRL Y-1031 F-60-10) TaxID=1206466 RepID=K0KFS1_WICCF|nr:putative transporter SEO1 [Wickerhamomyces ciferrii]CCH44005.1 putative transporter SEO1 [Wickerhamomyces ciferrii]
MAYNDPKREINYDITEVHGDSDIISNEKVETKKKSWRNKLFGESIKYKTKEEKTFVRKLDFWLISWTFIAYLIKSIDQANVSNAYVSGMQEELNFKGHQYNLLESFFKIGYSIALVPSQIMLNKIQPAYWLSSCELIWGILTALCAVPKNNPNGLYAIRFFMGIFESSSWPGIIIILGNYYNKEELALRIGLFQTSSYVGAMFTGFMQSSIHTTLNGKQGLSGWRWMFIINGLMTIVVAVSGFFIVPDTPENGGAKYWMNDDDRRIALERMERAGRKTKRNMTLKTFISTFTDWKTWSFVLIFAVKGWTIAPNYFNLYLKSLKNSDGSKTYTISQLNTIPIGGNALQIISLILFTKLASIFGHSLEFIIFQGLLAFFANVSLAVWPSSRSYQHACFFIMQFTEAIGPFQLTYMAEVFSDSPEKRAICTGITVVFVYANVAWQTIYLWPANEAPRYKYAYKVSSAYIAISIIGTIFYYYYVYKPAVERNENLQRKREEEENLGTLTD